MQKSKSIKYLVVIVLVFIMLFIVFMGEKKIKQRWIIERTFSWFDNDRRLCRNYEFLFESSENMVKLSAIKLLLNKI